MKNILKLRLANKHDSNTVLSWRNEPKTILNMKTKRALKLEEHEPWFLKSITASECVFLIIEVNSTPVGQLRYNMEGRMAKVSINITSSWHGKGVASESFSKGSKYVKDNNIADKVFARVLKTNVGSIKSMQRAGFKIIDEIIYDGEPHFYMTHILKDI